MTVFHDEHPARRSLSIKKGEHGEDVARLQHSANRVADHFPNIFEHHRCKVDGIWGPESAECVSRALFIEGADVSTYRRAQVKHGGHVSVHAQNSVRHPGSRVQRDFEAQRKRVDAARKDLREHAREAKRHPNVDLATEAAQLLLRHAPRVHYTMGPQRWDGINRHLFAARGAYPIYADCSAAYTWFWWNVLGAGADVLNGAEWVAGYTGTLLTHGHLVHNDAEGVAAIYGTGWPGKHIAYCLGDGTVISHGSEGGPYHLPLHYRSDLLELRAYV